MVKKKYCCRQHKKHTGHHWIDGNKILYLENYYQLGFMFDFLSTMDTTLRIFWIIAGIASLIFAIQTILVFVGIGGDTDFDEVTSADTVDDNGFGGVFSFRNLINFLLGYGWSGVVFYERIQSSLWLHIVCVGIGLLFVAAFIFMFRQMMHLSHDGTFKTEECVGLTADVYLRIPAGRSGRGKVQFSVKGSVHELDAVTDDSETLSTGSHAKIEEVLGSDLVRVSKAD